MLAIVYLFVAVSAGLWTRHLFDNDRLRLMAVFAIGAASAWLPGPRPWIFSNACSLNLSNGKGVVILYINQMTTLKVKCMALHT
jgi:hypothetical protein